MSLKWLLKVNDAKNAFYIRQLKRVPLPHLESQCGFLAAIVSFFQPTSDLNMASRRNVPAEKVVAEGTVRDPGRSDIAPAVEA